MVQIAGKYTHVKNENFLEQLKAFGIPDEAATKSDSEKPTLEVIVDGANITIKNGERKAAYVLNQEVDESLHAGLTVKSIAKLDGDTLTVTSKAHDGKGGYRSYKFSDTDVVVTAHSENPNVPTCKRFYKRA